MKLTPNESVLRVALLAFSVVFGILSISLVALGIVYFDELRWPRPYVALDFLELPVLLIVLGCLSLLMAIAGCYCAKSYNRRLLILYASTLVLILGLQLTIAIIAFKSYHLHKNGEYTENIMHEQINSPNYRDVDDFRKVEEYVSNDNTN